MVPARWKEMVGVLIEAPASPDESGQGIFDYKGRLPFLGLARGCSPDGHRVSARQPDLILTVLRMGFLSSRLHVARIEKATFRCSIGLSSSCCPIALKGQEINS